MSKLAPSDLALDHDRDMAAYRGPSKSGVAFPCHGLQIHADNVFCGRQAEIHLLDDALSPPLEGSTRQRTYSIYGLGGVGKTRTALTYASRFRDSYDAILVIQSVNPQSVSRSFTRIAQALQLREPGQSGNADDDNELVQQWLLESGM